VVDRSAAPALAHPTGAPADDAAVRSVHDAVYRVRFDEAGPDGRLRTSGFMRYAQDLAWLHSTALGFGREWYAARGLTWLVRAAELVVLAPVPMGRDVAARTEVVGIRRVWARRRGTFRIEDGSRGGSVNTDWVLIDGRGALTRIPPVFTEMFGGDDLGGSVGRLGLPPTPGDAAIRRLVVRPQELDPMGHANNAVYLDWLEESLLDAGAGPDVIAVLPRRYRLEYALAAEAGAELVAAAWPGEDGWSFRLSSAASGADLFRARLEVGDRATTSAEAER
jgi:acyl-ACP thioesterase